MVPVSVKTIAALSALYQGALAVFPDCINGPLSSNLVCSTSVNYLDRARAIVAEFTLDELINNTVNASPGVERLGLPAYNWWSEALHGVASSPGSHFAPVGQDFSSATSFPQPILMSAAFDDSLIHAIAEVVGTEARAFGNAGWAGLDFFTPNINPFKDPRWGRGQETPGEDPFRIAQYAYQLVTALQGGIDPQPFFKIVADCKHFAAYDLENWEGNDRRGFNAIVSLQDLSEYYTPSFQSCVRDAKVASIMCSYNAVNGVPSCANSYLLQDIIRDYFGFGEAQWITGDCAAVESIFDFHHYTSTLANASAVALHAGTDIDCGDTYSTSLGQAINESLVTEADIRKALVRQYASLVRLGFFDPADSQPYRQLGWSDVNTPDAQNLAYVAAVEGIVLLKNDGLLPISNATQSLALIGPWVNATTQMQGNYAGVAPFLISPLQALQEAGFDVTYRLGTSVSTNDTSGFTDAVSAALDADLVVYIGGVDNSVEAEDHDRTAITWPGNQLDLIRQLANVDKPLIVIQMGGGQVDDSEIKANSSVNALLWAGYPGQSGGTAIVDILTGARAPAGRLPTTQYPGDYVNQIPMTDMFLRPNSSSGSPGRTYKWYTGTPIFEFGFGLHYTNFSLAWRNPKASYNIQDIIAAAKRSHVPFVDLGLLDTFHVEVTNTGKMMSDYVALLFSNTTAGPSPAPLKELVSYTRLKTIAPGDTAIAALNVTLNTIARVDENGNRVLYPGKYELWLDTMGEIRRTIELTGERSQIADWPQPG